MSEVGSLARAAALAHWALLGAVYARLCARAFLVFPRDWDFLAYHLPGALATYGLTTYEPEPRLVAVIEGFPPLPRIVSGLLVLVTGRMSAAAGLNVLAFAALLGGLWFLLGRALSLRWLLTALLGVPLFVLHLPSGYVDLFAAAWLALGFAALSGLEDDATRPRAAALLAIGALGAAMASKFQAWPIAGCVGVALLWRFAQLARAGRIDRKSALALAAALALVLAFWPARNLFAFSNPVYPVQFPFAPALFPNATVEADSGAFNLPAWLAPHSRPVRVLASVAEWNRFHSGERFVWSLDQSARANPADSPHHRLGGWFPASVALLVCGAISAARRGLVPRSAQAAFAVALVLVAFVPQGHELRYWLFIPLALALATARGLGCARPIARRALQLGLIVAAAFVLWTTRPFALDTRPPEHFAPARARAFWAEQAARPSAAPVAICNVNPKGIYWSGPTFRQFRVRACFGEPG